MKSRVYLIDARHRISPDEENTIVRHKRYAQSLMEFSHGYCRNLIVLQPRLNGESELEIMTENFSIHRIRGKLNLLIPKKFVNVITADGVYNNIVLVAGDPLLSSILALRVRYLLRRRFSGDVRLQVQVHFELKTVQKCYKNRLSIRYFLTKISLKAADQLRFVDSSQAQEFIEKFQLKKDFVVIPVPLNISDYFSPQQRLNAPNSIAFIGRIHQERGLSEFLEISRIILAYSPDTEILVYGDGPERERFLSQLKSINERSNVREKGNLSQLGQEWGEIGVLISTAPSESYGRAIREAHVHGVPVLAMPSLGALRLLKTAPEGVVQVLAPDFTESDVIKAFDSLSSTAVPLEYSRELLRFQGNLPKEIALSWLGLMRSDN